MKGGGIMYVQTENTVAEITELIYNAKEGK
ncbi:hypothetical protein HONESTABE_224 [Bacillus phage HonestAbe]|nr:hypothetical protein HONESTABE_224 [Bacillus phage HonestAbe]